MEKKLMIWLCDEFEDFYTRHKITLRFPAAVGKIHYSDMELVEMTGRTKITENLRRGFLTVTAVTGDSVTFRVEREYSNKFVPEVHTLKCGESGEYASRKGEGEYVPSADMVLDYTLVHSLKVECRMENPRKVHRSLQSDISSID